MPSIHLPFFEGRQGWWCEARRWMCFEKVVGMERLVGDPSVLRQIGLSEY